MNIQLIATYLIILYAIAYTLFHLYKLLRKQKKSDCGGSCGGCDFKKELQERGVSPINPIKNKNFTYIKN